VKRGQFLKLNVIEKVRDSVILTTVGGMPAYIRVDSVKPEYNPAEVFPLLRKGDSCTVVQLADTLQRKYGQLPPFIKKKDKVTIIFKVLEVFPTEEAVTADRTSEGEKEKTNEIKVVEEYLATNKISAQKTARGAYVLITAQGDGPQVDSGKEVYVRYTGKIFPSGKVFESNVPGAEGNRGESKPLVFVIGQGAVIPGMDESLKMFKKGGKGTLYIPAFLAYGAQPGPSRKPNENLIFDITVEDVKDAPKAAPAPAMPPQMQTMPPSRQGQPQGKPQPQHK